jgi:hypothetical protein
LSASMLRLAVAIAPVLTRHQAPGLPLGLGNVFQDVLD